MGAKKTKGQPPIDFVYWRSEVGVGRIAGQIRGLLGAADSEKVAVCFYGREIHTCRVQFRGMRFTVLLDTGSPRFMLYGAADYDDPRIAQAYRRGMEDERTDPRNRDTTTPPLPPSRGRYSPADEFTRELQARGLVCAHGLAFGLCSAGCVPTAKTCPHGRGPFAPCGVCDPKMRD